MELPCLWMSFDNSLSTRTVWLFSICPEKVVMIVLGFGNHILGLLSFDCKTSLRWLLGRNGSGSD
jgi:hypothetical protein